MEDAGSSGRLPVQHCATLMPKYLQLIASGRKTVEGRVRAGMWLNVHPGDTIHFTLNAEASQATQVVPSPGESGGRIQDPESVTVQVRSAHNYETFEEMLRAEGIEACLPGVASLAEGVELYRSIPTYRERELIHQVVALRIALA